MAGAPFERREVASVLALRPEQSERLVVVEIAGEPGSGRTSVVRAVERGLSARGVRTLAVEAFPGRGSSRRTLADLSTVMGQALSEASRAALDGAVREALRRSEKADLMWSDVALTEATPALVPAAAELFGAGPAAFVLDDGQLGESLVWRFLFKVLALAPRGPRMLVAATDGSRELPVTYPGAMERHEVRLLPLSQEELEQLLCDCGVRAADAHGWAAALHAAWLRTPRAARLLADELEHSPALRPERAPELLSAGLRPLFERRLARLSAEERALLEYASISGSGINHWRMERLGPAPREAVTRVTAALVERGMLRRTYPGGKLRLVFREPDERLLVYGAMADDKRKLLHAQFARIVEQDDLDPEDLYSEVGRHLILTGDEMSGASKLLKAAEHLLRKGRLEEARRHFDEVLRRSKSARALASERLYALEGLADIEARTGTREQAIKSFQAVLDEGGRLLSVEDQVRLLRKLARGRLHGGNLQEAERLLSVAQGLCPDDMAIERALLYDLQANLGVRRADLVTAVTASQRALAIALKVKDDRLLGTAYRTMAALRYARGDLHAALGDLDAACELFEKTGDANGYAAACNDKGNVYGDLGRLQESIAHYQASLRIRQGLQDLAGVTVALNNLATLHITAGELDLAEQSLREALRIQYRIGELARAATAEINLAAVEIQRGRYVAALDQCEDAIALAERVDSIPVRLAAQLAKGVVLSSLGRLGEAVILSAEVEERARATGSTHSLVRALSGLGTALLAIGEFDQAEEKLLAGLRLCQEHGFAGEEVELLGQLVVLEMERGHLAAARKYEAAVRARPAPASGSDQRAQQLQLMLLERRESGEALLSTEQRAKLQSFLLDPSPDLRARVERLLAEGLPRDQGLAHARASYDLYAGMQAREELWRAALLLGQIEKELHLPESEGHLDEAARIVLSIAADLGDDHREAYFKAYGRRRVLLHARRLE